MVPREEMFVFDGIYATVRRITWERTGVFLCDERPSQIDMPFPSLAPFPTGTGISSTGNHACSVHVV